MRFDGTAQFHDPVDFENLSGSTSVSTRTTIIVNNTVKIGDGAIELRLGWNQRQQATQW